EPFQLHVFVAQLLELARLTRQHAAVGLPPAIEGLLGDPNLAADVAHSHARRDLLQDRRNLLDGKALSLHGTPSWPVGRIVPRTSPSRWTEKPGAPHSCPAKGELLELLRRDVAQGAVGSDGIVV